MMENDIAQTSVYTMRNRDDLDYVFASGGAGSYIENRSWKTALELFQKSQRAGEKMPLFFSAADYQSGLIYFAFLDDIEICVDDADRPLTRYSFNGLTGLSIPKPLSSLLLRSTGKPLSDNYIRPYAICYTPASFREWAEEDSLPVSRYHRKTGSECFHRRGRDLDFNLLEFWQWSSSDVLNNTLRGRIAEYIVAQALGLGNHIRSGWAAYDLLMPNGVKIEVKSAAYIQSWFQKEFSSISFGIQKTREWDEHTGMQSHEAKRQADIYVFCLLHHKIHETVDPLDVSQWTFYIVPTKTINEELGDQKRIGLKTLERLDPLKASFDTLASSVDRIGKILDRS